MLEGRLIALDGVDGCGKSSQIKALVEKLGRDYPNLEIVVTREPWDVESNEIGKRIRKTMMQGANKRVWADENELNHESLQYLFFLDRCVHYMKLIIPALEGGSLVITDRERMVTYAYGLATGIEPNIIKEWHDGICEPDLYYFLDVKPEVAIERLKKRYENDTSRNEIFEGDEAVKKNAIAFHKIAKMDLIHNLVTIDGTKTIEEIADSVYDSLVEKLGEWLAKHKGAK